MKVSSDCSSDRALECEAVWTECAQMCCGHVHSFNREERTVVLASLCVLGWNCSPVNWQAEKLQNSQKNCRFLRTGTVLCVPTLLPNDAANVWELRMGEKRADASVSKWEFTLVSAARCKSRFCIMPCDGMHANRDGDA